MTKELENEEGILMAETSVQLLKKWKVTDEEAAATTDQLSLLLNVNKSLSSIFTKPEEVWWI